MPTSGPQHIHYAITGAQLYLGFEGSATHRVSLASEHLVADFIALNLPRETVVVDLGACRYLDSTFAGWMIRLHQRLKHADGRLILSRCPETCWANLQVMGLTSLFEFEDTPTPPQTRRISCCDPEETDAEAIEFMLHAHENLAGVNDRNRQVFTPITDTLREELDKRR